MAQERYSAILICAVLFLALVFLGVDPAQAEPLNLGKKYDQTNYQEIQDLLFPALLNCVKKGEAVLQTSKLEFEWKKGDDFLKASQKNEGKYDIDQNGLLIERGAGKPPEFVYGFPFPKIDPKDPKVAEKIMENKAAQVFSLGSHHSINRTRWVSGGGKVEREVVICISSLYYHQRREGPIPNPDHFLAQRLVSVIEPFGLSGSNSLIWTYNDRREDTAFIYIPAARRVRRISASDPSNPLLGSDGCPDDAYIWSGKNASMRWRLLGEKTLLAPFSSSKKLEAKESENGSIDRIFVSVKRGIGDSAWKGAAWYPVGAVWSPRTFWIIEAESKNPAYQYGKQVLYIDKETYTGFFKEIYDRDGQYWKKGFLVGSYQVTPTGKDLLGVMDYTLLADDKNPHSTINDNIRHPSRDCRMGLPLSIMGPNNFTENALIQLSK